MITTRLFYSLMVAMLVLTACAPQAAATPIATAAPPAMKAPSLSPTPTATLDHGTIPTELVGTWSFMAFGQSWTAELTADGTYFLYPPNGQLDIGGSFGISGSEAVFRDEIRGIGMLCVPAEGRYHWELMDDRLMFTVIDDKCTVGRIEQWTAGWQKVKE